MEEQKKIKPLKRHPALVPLSKDHHFGLLLCWKIRTGIKKEIASDRIINYVIYFFNDHLIPHFKEEENYIFTLLDEKNEKRIKAEQQHRTISNLVSKLSSDPENARITLEQIEKEVEAHIRFEERDLFPYIQNTQDEAGLEALRKQIEEIHQHSVEVWEDEFWGR